MHGGGFVGLGGHSADQKAPESGCHFAGLMVALHPPPSQWSTR